MKSSTNVIPFFSQMTLACSFAAFLVTLLNVSSFFLLMLVFLEFCIVFYCARKFPHNAFFQTHISSLPIWGNLYLLTAECFFFSFFLQNWQEYYPRGYALENTHFLFQRLDGLHERGVYVFPLILCAAAIPIAHKALIWCCLQVLPPTKRFFMETSVAERWIAIVATIFMTGLLFYCSSISRILIAPSFEDIPSDAKIDSCITFPNGATLRLSFLNAKIYEDGLRVTDRVFGLDVIHDCSATLNIFRHPYYNLSKSLTVPIVYGIAAVLWTANLGKWCYLMSLSMAFFQILLWVLCGMMVRRLVEDVTDRIFSFAVFFFYVFSFPFLFVFIPERFILSVFLLVAFVFFRGHYRPKENPNRITASDLIWALAALGATVLAAAAVAIAFIQGCCRKNIRITTMELGKWLILCAIPFFFLSFNEIKNFQRDMKETFTFSSNKSSTELFELQNMYRYLHFMESNLFFPSVVYPVGELETTPIAQVPTGYFWFGGIIGIMDLFSAWMYRKSMFIQLALGWILVSLFILAGLGFGAVLEEMTLYVSYFSWAVLPLFCIALYVITKNRFHCATAAVYIMGMVSLYQVTTRIVTFCYSCQDIYVSPFMNSPF